MAGQSVTSEDELRKQILQKQIRLKQNRLQSVDTSPFNIGEQSIVDTWGDPVKPEDIDENGRSKLTGLRVIKTPSDEEMALAEKGVDTRTGADVSRIAQGFMPDDNRAVYIKQQLKNKLGEDTEVRRNKQGQVEFVNPETNRWTTFDEYGFTTRDLQDMFGDSITLAADVIGSIYGFAFGGIPGETIGSGVATTVGELTKLGIGRAAGLHDLDINEMSDEATRKGGIAAVGTLSGRGLMQGGHRLYYGKQVFTDEEADMILAQSKDADKAISEINGRISGEHRVEPLMGERSGVEAVMDMEATIQQGQRNIPLAVRIREQKRESEKGLEEFFDVATGKARPDTETVGRDVKETLQSQVDSRKERAVNQAKGTQRQAKGVADDLPTQDVGASANQYRQFLKTKKEQIAEIEQEAWETYKKTANYDEVADVSDVKIPRSEGLDALIDKMSKEQSNAIFTREGSNKKILLDSKLVPDPDEAITMVDTKGNAIATFNKDGDYDLVHIQRSLNYLKKQLRISEKGLSSEEPDVGDLKRITGELQKARNEYLLEHNPELLRQIEHAEAITKYKHDTFDKKIVGEILKKENGYYVLDDQGVFMKVIATNNGAAAKEYASVLMDDPRAMQAARNGVLALYKKTVVDQGIPDPVKHARFMENYGDTISVFFRGGESEKIKKLGGLARTVAAHQKKLDRYEKAFKRTFKGKVTSMSPRELTHAFFKNPTKENSMSGFDHSDVRRLRNFLDMYSKEHLEAYKASVTYQLKEKIKKEGIFNPDRLEKLLENTGDISGKQIGKLGTLFGAQYARDMRTLLKVLRMVEKKGLPLPQPGDPAGVVAGKLYMGPLHRASRFFSKGGEAYTKAQSRAILEAVTNPDKLRALVASRHGRQTRERTAAILGSFGALSLMSEE